MSSDVIYASKNYRNNWLSQFGLYRYESATLSKASDVRRRKMIWIRSTCCVAIALAFIFCIIMIANYMSNYSENERIILLRKLDHLTTVYYPDEQISSYHGSLSTTPMTEIARGDNESKPSSNSAAELLQNGWHPTNHRSKYASVRRGADQTHQRQPKLPQKRMFFADSDDDDDEDADDGGDYNNAYYDYVESPHRVNSIQDILAQGATVVQPSMSYSRTAKIAGVYWRQKPTRSDPFQPMESNANGQVSEPTAGPRTANATDPFARFKPSSPGDVNLLASANPLKLISPYKQHRPRPLTSAPDPFNKHASESDAASEASAHTRYQHQHRINAARLDKQAHQQARPFSLMLDVYPMLDDDGGGNGGGGGSDVLQTMSATRPFSSFTPSFYPVHVNAMTHSAQYGNANPHYNHVKYAQLQPYRWPFIKSASSLGPTADPFYPAYMLNHIQPSWYRINPRTMPVPSQPVMAASEPVPSQITLHLSLYPTPGHANHHDRSRIDAIHIDNVLSTAETIGKRRLVDIPPFSALKINALSFNASDDALNAAQLSAGDYGEVTTAAAAKSRGFAVDSDINQPLNAITSTASSGFLERADLVTAMPTASLTTAGAPVTQPAMPFTVSIN